ncbi:pyridoxal phosphate-dependent decarboxylase family protein [Phenylobacterium hankyongense]|uniref:pyridoxal phosphate-dependent decarboxylase family protein n=1 Tax=Phenylobacterium hankyongense TaxID=1813876 RepID=UPI001A9D0138|nr:pyridoxal-dependent decarboxylase [Phenylobacterium hankyongense]
MSLDPADWSAVRGQGHRMLDDLFDHLQGLRAQPVWREPPAAARQGFREALPLAPSALEQVHETFLENVLPYSSGNAHPGFMGWVQGGGTVVGMLAEMLAGGMNSNLGGRDHMPLEVEQQVLAWTRQMFGFPDTASGLFLTGASQANFLATLVARMRVLGGGGRTAGLGEARLTAYASRAVHGCVGRALDMSGIGSLQLRAVPVDDHHRIDLATLRAAIAADRQAGCTPFLIVGTAGTVDIGGIDDLAGLADIAADEDVHFHVDGALAALGVLAPSLAPRLAGIERADSIAFDWHKWGQTPYDAGFLLVRDGELHRRTFASDAAYLQRAARGLAGGDWWPCDYGPDLSRSFRALKTWFTLKTYGTAALGAVIEHTCALARELADRIAAEPELELAAPVQLNIVCFRYRGPDAPAADADALNAEIVAELQAGGDVAPSLTRIDGRTVIRAAIVNHRTDRRDIEALVASTLSAGRQCTRRRAA